MAVRKMIVDGHQLALGLLIFSAVFAFLMLTQTVWLLFRRRHMEKDQDRSDKLIVGMTREIMAVLSGKADIRDARHFNMARNSEKLDTISRMLQLMRGNERAMLLKLAEATGVCAASIKRLKHGKAAKRVSAMRILEQTPVRSAILAIEEIMRTDPVIAVRLEAATTLARIGCLPEPLAVIEALDLVHQPLTRLHEALFRSIAGRDAERLVEIARDTGFAHVRPIVVEALGWSGSFAVVGSLADFANDENPEVRCAALKAARRLEHPAAGTWAIHLLVDPAEPVRIQAIQTCARLGVRHAVPLLQTLLESPSWWIRARAREALEILRPAQPLQQDATGIRQ